MAGATFVVPSVLNPGGGERRIAVSADDLAGALAAACAEMGPDFERRVMEGGRPRSLVNVYLNGKNARFGDGLATRLSDGDEVYILPAVAGGEGGELPPADLDRYSRQIMLGEIGYAGQARLRASRACVVGMGGLGNPVAMRLAAMGVGRLRIVDRDVVERSNLHRQVLFDESDVGRVKVEAAAARLSRMNSGCEVEALPVSINDHTAAEVCEGCDVVIDALDSVEARYSLNRACVAAGIPLVMGAAVGVSGQALTVVPGESACYHCIFPALDEGSMPTCSIEGVLPPVLSVVGAVEVAEAVRVLLGRGAELSRRILHVDMDRLVFQFTDTSRSRAEECPVCGSGREERPRREGMLVEELCGRDGGKRTFSLTPPVASEIDVGGIAAAARRRGYSVESSGGLGVSLSGSGGLRVSLLRRGSAVVTGAADGDAAVSVYRDLVPGPRGAAGR